MESFSNHLNEIKFLTRSGIRVRLLRDLHQDGPRDKYALRRRFECDRTTLQRNLDALIEHGWVEHKNGTYQITQAGELMTTGLTGCLETLGTAMDLQPFLQWMPDDAFDFDIKYLTDAEIVVADPSNPDRVLYKHIDKLEAANRFRGCTPHIGRRALEVVWQRVMTDEGSFEVVIPNESVESLQGEYAAKFAELSAAEQTDILVTDAEVPYYLGIFDDIVQIGNTTDTGMRRAILETDHHVVRAWAVDTYEDHKQQASMLENGPPTGPELQS